MKTAWHIASLLGLLWPTLAHPEVVRFEVTQRATVPGTAYEEITGRLHFEIDPAHPRNRIIADVALAPRNAEGRVPFSSGFRLFKPLDAGKANGAAWMEIPNRGGRCGLGKFFAERGFTVAQVGWEFDVPAQPDKLRIQVPAARQENGLLCGLVRATFTPDKRADSFTVTDLTDYPPVDPAGPDSSLLVRSQAAFPEGREIPRSEWSLEGQKVSLQGGFEPGRTYEIAYLAGSPPVAGLGLAALRDAVAWLKHGPSTPVPLRHVYAFGSSQCGRLLREFVYLGFNTDELERPVLDGIMAHIAGAGRLIINQRWSVPRSVAAYHTASYPFADTALPDPVSGVCEGVLENPRVTHSPKIFYTNTASEYWGAGRVAALTHTDAEGTRDVPLPENVRSYLLSGTQHGPAAFPPASSPPGSVAANPVNPGPVVLALRLAMHQWVTQGLEPPPSAYPKRSDGTLVAPAEVHFPQLPGIRSPHGIRAGQRLPNPLWPGGAGAGAELPLLVPQVDADGNDLAGVRLPDVSVPLATCTGWAFRHPSPGAPSEPVPLRGSWIPFSASRAAQEARRDPRPSVEERYPSREAYLARVSMALQELTQQRFLLAEDAESIRKTAAQRWDWVTSQNQN